MFSGLKVWGDLICGSAAIVAFKEEKEYSIE
jgi:hypothetical protein